MRSSLLFLLLSLTLLGCLPPDDNDYIKLPVDTKSIRNNITLGPGDIFEVRVYGEKDLSGEFRVSGEGSIMFPLIGEAMVKDKSASQIATLLQDKLAAGYLKAPYVTVAIKQYNSKKVFVLGQVNKPGTFPFEGEMNIIQAITQAGGFTDTARKNSIIVTRVQDGVEKRIRLPGERISEGLAPNFSLKPADIVFVPETVL
jgi:protein involved in polysaccharide export with SLBB domain